jgi:hypothetical protein
LKAARIWFVGACIGVLLLGGASVARAQRRADVPASDPAERGPAAKRPPPDPTAELVRRLMTEGSEDEDLAWLYSNADEYSPSELTGEPIPVPAFPERGEGSPREWDPRWQKFGLANYLLTGVGLAVNIASSAIPEAPDRWRSQNSLDEWGRRNLGYDDYESGRWARDLSDVLTSLNMAYPVLIDALVVTYWYRQSPELAEQMALISAEAAAVAALLQGPVSGFTSRERPYGRDCGTKIPADLDDCAQVKRYRSFFSGHTSMAFATAGVTCSHHLTHRVFGDAAADGIACGAAMLSAGTVGAMRIVGRQHYVTDVLAGAAIGTLSGIGVPWLFHYGPVARSGAASDFHVTLRPMANGISVGGGF